MPQSKQKFIMTVDGPTAQNFITAGLKLVSNNGGRFVFLNQPPKNFNFDKFDKSKFVYTNMLSI